MADTLLLPTQYHQILQKWACTGRLLKRPQIPYHSWLRLHLNSRRCGRCRCSWHWYGFSLRVVHYICLKLHVWTNTTSITRTFSLKNLENLLRMTIVNFCVTSYVSYEILYALYKIKCRLRIHHFIQSLVRRVS